MTWEYSEDNLIEQTELFYFLISWVEISLESGDVLIPKIMNGKIEV